MTAIFTITAKALLSQCSLLFPCHTTQFRKLGVKKLKPVAALSSSSDENEQTEPSSVPPPEFPLIDFVKERILNNDNPKKTQAGFRPPPVRRRAPQRQPVVEANEEEEPPLLDQYTESLGLPLLPMPNELYEIEDFVDEDDAPRNPPTFFPLLISDAKDALNDLGSANLTFAEMTDSAWVLWAHSMGGRKMSDDVARWVEEFLPGGIRALVELMILAKFEETGQAVAGILRNLTAVGPDMRRKVFAAGAVDAIIQILSVKETTTAIRQQLLGMVRNLSRDPDLQIWRLFSQPTALEGLLTSLDSVNSTEKELASICFSKIALSDAREVLLPDNILDPLCSVIRDSRMYDFPDAQRWIRQCLSHLIHFCAQRGTISRKGIDVVPLVGKEALLEYDPPFEDPQVRLKTGRALPGEEDLLEEMRDFGYISFGAGDVLLGLQRDVKFTEAELQALDARTRQRFLARVKVMENIFPVRDRDEPGYPFTLFPRNDAVARLGIFLELPSHRAAAKAAGAIAEFANTDENRLAIANSGSLPFLVAKLTCGDDEAAEAAAMALSTLVKCTEVKNTLLGFGLLKNLTAVLRDSGSGTAAKEAAMVALAETIQQPRLEADPAVIDGEDSQEQKGIALRTPNVLEEARGTEVFGVLEDLAASGSPLLQQKASELIRALSPE